MSVAGMSIRAGCRILRAQKNSFYYGNDMGGTPHGRDRRVFVIRNGLGLRRVSDPLALDVCPSWIHGQRTKEAVLLCDDDTITINAVTPRYKIQ